MTQAADVLHGLVAQVAAEILGRRVYAEKPGALRHARSVGITVRRSKEDADG